MTNSTKNLEASGVSVVIGSYNRKAFLKKTIETLRIELENCQFPHEIIIVDGGSTDGTLSWLIKQKDIITIVQHNRGEWKGKPIEQRSWGYFMNLGFKSAKGKYICMISDDCLVVPGAIINGYTLFESKLRSNEKVGAIAFYYRDWPDRIIYQIQMYWGIINVNHGLYLKEALQIVNYADEKTYRFYKGDVDLVFKLAYQNYSTMVSENSFIEHFGHANSNVRNDNFLNMSDDGNQLIKKWSPIFNNIKLNPYEQTNLCEVSFNDKQNTIQYWQKMIDVKVFLVRRYVRRYLANHVPTNIKRKLAPLRKK